MVDRRSVMTMAMAFLASSSASRPPPFSSSSAVPRCCCRSAAACGRRLVRDANKKQGHRQLPRAPSALPETAAASVLVAGAVGVAATLLLRSSSSSSSSSSEQQEQEEEEEEAGGEECGECGGTGLCGRCKGEGFVFKQLSEETATKARKAAKNMATRYTAGLPTKWTYCNKCSSTRTCSACRGSGRITTTSA